MDTIKESFDHLPVAVCFFDKNGIVRLINHRMLALTCCLQKNGIQTLDEMQHALRYPPNEVQCLDHNLNIYRFQDGRAFRFSYDCITTKAASVYTQVIATDVTAIMWHRAELEAENKKLTHANERLRKLFENMPEIIREEETLAMKQLVHDDIGYSVLAARRVFSQQGELEEIQETADILAQAIAVLYRSEQMRNESDALAVTCSRARAMGVSVHMHGAAPKRQKNGTIAATAIRECAANCARHAHGTQVWVNFEQSPTNDTFAITNNGTPPREKIREGGGLSLLRRRIEEAGGTMRVQSVPVFELRVTLPKTNVQAAQGQQTSCDGIRSANA